MTFRRSPEMMAGLKDKLYWRQFDPETNPRGRYHCFKRDKDGRVYESLCGGLELERSGGQGCRRPRSELRCAVCDGREMQRRGWEESGPPS